LVAPVVFVGLDEVVAEDLAGGVVGDGHGCFVGEDEDGFSGVVVADSEVVEFSGSSEGEFAELVDGVVADSVVGGEGLPAGGGFDGRGVGLLGCL
jgi:hypothetical protein